jgi:hypothetical protein
VLSAKSDATCLGVGMDADLDQIKKAYRTMARNLHPVRPTSPHHQHGVTAIDEGLAHLGSGVRTRRARRGGVRREEVGRGPKSTAMCESCDMEGANQASEKGRGETRGGGKGTQEHSDV